jgi:DNA-binding PadR family transcriptional regulator
MSNIFRDVFLGFIRVHVLYHASKERIFGVEMIKELAHHGYEVSPGTIYPILHGLEKAGYLSSEQEVIAGKVRKYYRITPPGRKALAELKKKIQEMTSEVLGDDDAKVKRAKRTSKKSRP